MLHIPFRWGIRLPAVNALAELIFIVDELNKTC